MFIQEYVTIAIAGYEMHSVAYTSPQEGGLSGLSHQDDGEEHGDDHAARLLKAVHVSAEGGVGRHHAGGGLKSRKSSKSEVLNDFKADACPIWTVLLLFRTGV